MKTVPIESNEQEVVMNEINQAFGYYDENDEIFLNRIFSEDF